jgi:hypothetical protein
MLPRLPASLPELGRMPSMMRKSGRNGVRICLGFWCWVLLGSGLCTMTAPRPGIAEERTGGENLRFSRESLKKLHDVLDLASKELYLWNRANRAYLQTIGPAYVKSGLIDELRDVAERNAQIKELSNLFDHAGTIAEFASAISGDLQDKRTFLTLGSHTFEVAEKFAIEWTTDSDRVATWLRKGLISPLTGKAAGYLGLHYGAGDVMVGAQRVLGGQGDRAEAWATLLDGVNKAAWGALGYAMSGGNDATAKTFSIIGEFAAKSGQVITAPMFTAYANWKTGTDKNLIQIWAATQQGRLGRSEKVQSFEEFYAFDSVILGQVSEADRRSADARFGLRSRSRPPGYTETQIVTRTFQEHYREVCKTYFCVRTDLPDTTAHQTKLPVPSDRGCGAGGEPCQPPSTLRGVLVAPAPQRSGSADDALGQGILSLPRLGPAQ